MTTTLRVVSIEDDKDFRMLLREWLSPRYELIQLALAPEEGLVEEIASLQPDLVLMDHDLGSATGARVCEELREYPEMKQVPVVFLTGVRDEETLRQAQEAGAFATLFKPISGAELNDLLADILSASSPG